jgi:hypothetical protein
MRKGLGLAAVSAIVALTLMAAPELASATRGARAASTPTTWAPGCNGGPITWSQHPPELAFTCGGPTAIVVHLRWRHWGNATAQGSGTYEYAGCTPNCAQARRRRAAATVTASNIGYCGTRRVYGKISVRFAPPGRLKNFSQPTVCSYTGQRPTSRPAPKPAPSNPSEFRVRLAGGTFGCAVGEVGETLCFGVPLTPEGSAPNVQVAKLQSGGQVTACVEHGLSDVHCFEGNLGDPIPYLSPGQQTTVGPFTCKVLQAGVECTVTATGKGFLLTPEAVTEVGG